MTVVAWDGKTLAADRQSTDVGLRRSVTKIWRTDRGLIATSGNSAICVALKDWFEDGSRAADFPDKEKTSNLLVIGWDGTVRLYDGHPTPITFDAKQFAMGSGRDYAEAAMFLGCDARRAVEVACHFDSSCGNGIDALTLEKP